MTRLTVWIAAASVALLAAGCSSSAASGGGLITGVDYTPPLLLRAGRAMGLRGVNLRRYLILPASLPAYVAGLKQGWAFAWRSLIAGELVVSIVGPPGLGVLLNTSQNNLGFAGATSVMIVILIIGIVVDMVFARADTRAAAPPWPARPGSRELTGQPRANRSVRRAMVDADDVARRITERAGFQVTVDCHRPVQS